MPYRTIAGESLISLATMGKFISELAKEEYFNNYNNKFQVKNRNALLNRWLEMYCAILRPKLVKGRFRFATAKDRENWQKLILKNAYWGGESAGALLTKHLHPEKFTVFSTIPITELIKQLRVVPDSNGEVELLNIFWNTETMKSPIANAVPPLLVYADLYASLDSRNHEIAQRIKKQYNV